MHLKHKVLFVQCMEKVLLMIKRVKTGLWSFTLDDAPQSGRPVEVLIAIKSRHLRTIHITMWEAQHTQNSQINKAIGGKKNGSFILQKKKNRTDFLANPMQCWFLLNPKSFSKSVMPIPNPVLWAFVYIKTFSVLNNVFPGYLHDRFKCSYHYYQS